MSKKRGPDGEMAADGDLKKLVTKHASLKQDYNELQRETRALKKRLQRAKLKKENLLAEVRFLRRRHRFLTKKSPAETTVNEVQPQPQKQFLAAAQAMAPEYDYAVPLKQPQPAQPMASEYGYVTGGSSSEEDVSHPVSKNEPFSTVDYTHSFENKPSAAREFQVIWEPLRTTVREEAPPYAETVKRKPLLESAGLSSDLNLSIFKDIPTGFVLPNRTGKRKISWQDQVALKV